MTPLQVTFITMQTFLPYPDFATSAEALRFDTKRLGKQRVETLQILKSLLQGGGLHGGWSKHPASRMWESNPIALLRYQQAVCDVWKSKGFKDTCWEKSRAFFTEEELERFDRGEYEMPEWFGDPDFHKAHRSSLVFKAPELYAPLFPDINPSDELLPYIWPGKSLREASEVQKAAELAIEEENMVTIG